MRSLRVLSKLLIYPSAETMLHMDAMKKISVEDGFLKARTLKSLCAFMDEFAAIDLMKAQENYVELFDRGRTHCLHLYEHVHGESRFRGQAMIDLSNRYYDKGLQIGVSELPDYLPLFLEFISICDPEEGLESLGQAAPVIAVIGEKLKRGKSGYATVFTAIVELSGANLKPGDIQKAADAALPNIKTLDELDEQWEEPAAFDDGVACGTCDPTPLQPASQSPQMGAYNE